MFAQRTWIIWHKNHDLIINSCPDVIFIVKLIKKANILKV